jgi:hydrogenase maturation factor
MHDSTEGGLAGALWELAIASQKTLVIEAELVYIPPLAMEICDIFSLNPFACLASGALLLTSPPSDARDIIQTMTSSGIRCDSIGKVEGGLPEVYQTAHTKRRLLPRPERDEIGKLFEHQ